MIFFFVTLDSSPFFVYRFYSFLLLYSYHSSCSSSSFFLSTYFFFLFFFFSASLFLPFSSSISLPLPFFVFLFLTTFLLPYRFSSFDFVASVIFLIHFCSSLSSSSRLPFSSSFLPFPVFFSFFFFTAPYLLFP